MYTIEDLSYDFDALEPILSRESVHLHHQGHLKKYVQTLNKLTEQAGIEGKTVEELSVGDYAPGIKNNASQIFCHHFYFKCLTPDVEKNKPSEEMQQMLTKHFGSLEQFQEEFTTKALQLFGSGWVWLLYKDQHLSIVSKANADSPLEPNTTCLLTCDVWEHAYYLDYRNIRASFLNQFWTLVNWDFVSNNLKQCKKKD